jgi:hypothetical protein
MAPRTVPLNTSGTVKLSAAGAGTVTLAPTGLENWHVTRVAVTVTTNVLEPVARVYIGSVAPGNLLAGTYTGSLDSSDEDQYVSPGQPLLCVWTGGDAGATATLSVFGEVTYER